MSHAVLHRQRPHAFTSLLAVAAGVGVPFLACGTATGDASLATMMDRIVTSPHPMMLAYALPCMVIATIAVVAQLLAWLGRASGAQDVFVLIYDGETDMLRGGLAFFVALMLCGLSFGVFFVGMLG